VKFAVSNIALAVYDHADDFGPLADIGLSGLEVAPSRVWRDTWAGLTGGAVADYHRAIEAAGLSVVGLHSLFFDHPELGLFKDQAARAASLDFLEHLSGVCRDLGGRTLIYGGGRNRGTLSAGDARTEAIDFFGELSKRMEAHGTCFCFEPLGPADSDFINSAFESLDIVNEVASPTLAVQLDAKALVENDEAEADTFRAVAGKLVHFHANEPGLGILGSSGTVDHAALGAMLRDIGYGGFVSIEQRMIDAGDPLAAIRQSAQHLKECYS
jgi:sugar phosphate isomerase/epimerase